MPTIYDIIKGQRVLSVKADDSVLEAARFMTDHKIGAVPVLRDGELVGIFSERDLMTRVVAGARSPGQTRVSEVMTAKPRTVPPDESVERCLFIMREFGFRHLPVVDGSKLLGLVSLRDVLLRNATGKASA